MAMTQANKDILDATITRALTYTESFSEAEYLHDRPLIALRDLFLKGFDLAYQVQVGLLSEMPTTLDGWQ